MGFNSAFKGLSISHNKLNPDGITIRAMLPPPMRPVRVVISAGTVALSLCLNFVFVDHHGRMHAQMVISAFYVVTGSVILTPSLQCHPYEHQPFMLLCDSDSSWRIFRI